MKTKLIYIVLILGMVTLDGCRKVLDFNDDEIKPLLVVNCFVTPDSIVTVDLTSSHSTLYKSNFFDPVKNATIIMSCENEEFSDFSYVSEPDTVLYYDINTGQQLTKIYDAGSYQSKTATVSSNKTYRVTIDADGFESVSAETRVPPSIPVETIDTFTTVQTDQYTKTYTKNAKIHFTDPGSDINYYQLKMEVAAINVYIDPVMGTPTATPYYYSGYIDSDDPVFSTEDNNDIFGGSYNRFSIFDDKLFNGKKYGLSFTIDATYEPLETDSGYYYNYEEYSLKLYRIKLISLSESMFNYLKTVTLQQTSEGDPFSDPVLVYTNIDNGTGIFGAFTSSSRIISYNNLPEELQPFIPDMSDEELFNYIRHQYKVLYISNTNAN